MGKSTTIKLTKQQVNKFNKVLNKHIQQLSKRLDNLNVAKNSILASDAAPLEKFILLLRTQVRWLITEMCKAGQESTLFITIRMTIYVYSLLLDIIIKSYGFQFKTFEEYDTVQYAAMKVIDFVLKPDIADDEFKELIKYIKSIVEVIDEE